MSDDGTQYTFFLERNVRFHDGSPFDAAAVKFNFDRMLDKTHPYHDTGPFPLSFFFERVQQVQIVDSHTVRLVLDEPFAPLLSNLAYPAGLMVSPRAVANYGKDLRRHPVGTGPFRFSSWETNRRIVLERYGGYRSTPAALRRLIFRPIADPMTRVAELRAGSVDLVAELSPDNVAHFRNTANFHVVEAAGPHLWFLILNTKKPPLDDVRVRRALNYAVDKRALVEEVLQDTATVAAGPIAHAFGEPAGDVEPYAYDPERARRLLEEAGVELDSPLVLAAPQSGSGMLAPIEMATAIQANLRAIGMTVQIQTYEWNSYLTKINAGLDDVDLAEMAWMTNDPDTLPFLALRSEAQPPSGFNSGWYSNPEVDELLRHGRRATDAGQRATTYATVQRIVHDEAPWVFVASWKQNVVVNDRVTGMRLEPSFLLYLDEVNKR